MTEESCILPDIIPYEDILRARDRIKEHVIRTPLIPLNMDWEHGKIYLKLENLQSIGCFKVRGACNAVTSIDPQSLQRGIYTASAGNFGQGVAYFSRKFGVPCDVYVPDHAPLTKLNAMQSLGAQLHKVTFTDWWKILNDYGTGRDGKFVHPVCDHDVIAGNGTAGIEIFEDLPEVDAIVVPYGGGGFSCGVSSAIRHLKPDCKVYASEVETAAPLSISLDKGQPSTCKYTATFVDGIGSTSILKEMWPLVKNLIDGSIVVSVREIADAVKLLVEKNHVVAEGAGASAVAAALTGKAGHGNIVCCVSGGNLDTIKLIEILRGSVPK